MVASPAHGLLDPTLQGIHAPYQWVYAAETNRLAATGFLSTDVGKLALQQDDHSLWILTSTTPEWVAVGITTKTSDAQVTILKRNIEYSDDLNFQIALQDNFLNDFE